MFNFRVPLLPRLALAALCLALTAALGGCASVPKAPNKARYNGLDLTVLTEPSPLRLGDTRRLSVVMKLANRSRRFVRLEFPTTQRMEVIARDASGRQLVVWSEDEAFDSEPCSVGINPGEHLEYRAVIGTRDLVAGRKYIIVAYITGYPKLSVEIPITPEP
ncbi:MAG: BsuPI-related putative proteinase inhibitor [Chthoniobacteraceae bacterium]